MMKLGHRYGVSAIIDLGCHMGRVGYRGITIRQVLMSPPSCFFFPLVVPGKCEMHLSI